MDEVRRRVRRAVYALSAVIIAILLIRFGLKMLGVPAQQAIIVDVFYQISYIFVAPFIGIAIDLTSGAASVELTSIVAMIMWMAIFMIAAEVICAFLHDDAGEIIINVVNVFFKFIEFFLLARLLFRMFAVQTGVNGFVDIIYGIAGIVYTPFAGIAPGIQIGPGVIELSTMVALIIVIVLDLVTDGFLQSLIGKEKKPEASAG